MGKVLVIGMGISGIAAAQFLKAKGYDVVAADANVDVLSKACQQLKIEPVFDFSHVDFCVLSPGVPPKDPMFQRVIQQKVPLIGEAELAFRYTKQWCVGITGTNGKTTVTLLTEHVLKSAGLKARALGNVGTPLTTYVLNADPDEIIVAELSSYQLETMTRPVFEVGIVLNITPDHLDRYPTMEAYAEAKLRLHMCMKKDGKLYLYSQIEKEFSHLLASLSYQTFGDIEKIASLCPLSYRDLGDHEKENALAVWLIVREFGVTPDQFTRALEAFRKPAHRIEYVASINGVHYYDDSKGTNLDAVVRAVKAMKGPVVLIAGGVDKGASYLPWKEIFQGKVKQIFVLGQAAEKILRELGAFFAIEIVESLSSAVEKAAMSAESGENVLLSPGCSSFDMFRDYAHRGDEFKRIVHQLEERRKKS